MMTGQEGIEEADIEEEIRRELDALKDWEIKDIENDIASLNVSESMNPGHNDVTHGTPEVSADSVETYIRLLQSRNAKVEDDLTQTEDVLQPIHHSVMKDFDKLTDENDEEISEELKEKVLIEIEELETKDESSGNNQYDPDDVISSLEEASLSNLKELEKKQDLKSDRLQSILGELKEKENSRRQREETIREQNKRKADEEYKRRVTENKNIKLKLDEEARSKRRELENLEKLLQLEMEDLDKKQGEERLALQKLKDEEKKKQLLQQEKACITIQKNYRRFRILSQYGNILKVKRQERWRRRQQELEALERKEKQLMEEAIKRAKEEEKQHLEEIEKRKKDEEERKRKEEERKKKEEEERKKELEEKRKREEEERRRKKEEEKRKREEEERRRREDADRLKKEEEERRRQEDERRRREEEERKKQEEQEKKRNEEEQRRKLEEEKRKKMDEKRKEAEKRRLEQERKRAEKEKKKTEDEEEMKSVQFKNIEEQRRIVDDRENTEIERNKKAFSQDGNINGDAKEHSLPSADDPKKELTDSCQRHLRGSKQSPIHNEQHEVDTKDRIERKSVNSYHGSFHGKTQIKNDSSDLSSEFEPRRLEWLKRTTPWSSISVEENKVTKSRSRPRRPLSASQKLPSVSEEELAASSSKFTSLDEVSYVNLKDLPARNLKILLKCRNLKSIFVRNCGLLSAESFENCKFLQEINLSENCIQSVSCQNIESLQQLDLSSNQLTSIHGLDGCNNLHSLKLAGNKITRIGTFSPNKVMHLSLQNNQLITTKGLSQMKYVQTLDFSNNYLNQVEQLDSCPLLGILVLRGNNLQKAPDLLNHVLLREIYLSDNSISSLESLSKQWLPLLQCLYVDGNSLSSLSSLCCLPMLEILDIRNNLISDEENLIPGLVGCHQLRILRIDGNPVCEDPSIETTISKTLPNLNTLDEKKLGSEPLNSETYNKTLNFFSMCRAQILAQDNLIKKHEDEIRNSQNESNDKDTQVLKRLDIQSHHFKELLDLTIQHRLQQENFQDDLSMNSTGVMACEGPVVEPENTSTTKPYQSTIVCQDKGINEDTKDPDSFADMKEPMGAQRCWKPEDFSVKHVRNERHHKAATTIQARFRGYRMRKKYLEATKFAHYPGVDLDDEEFNFDEEVDLTMFDMDEAALDSSWVPTSSSQSVSRPATQFNPTPNQQKLPTATKEDDDRPFAPRQAWRSPDSPLSQNNPRRVVPPLDTTSAISEQTSCSGAHTERSHRTSELSSEWGFSKDATAELMLKRAKRMKYNALRKKKLNDPSKRFELFKKTDAANKARDVQPVKKKKEKQWVDYFTGRPLDSQQTCERSTPRRDEEEKTKKEMTFSWVYDQAVLHKDKGDEILRDTKGYFTESSPVKSQLERSPPVTFPKMDPVILAGRNLPLVASPLGNPRPEVYASSCNTSAHSRRSWNQEKTHSNPDLRRVGVNRDPETREKSNSADARIMRERNKLL